MIRVTRSAVIDAPIARVWEVLRDFNSHWAWHPAVGESAIENGEPADQVGCVRNFFLKDGNHIREQLLALSDRDHVSTYCILEATLPMKRYVATVQLKPVTDGERTFWHWQSTFEVPRGREKEFEELVGKGVYEGGFEGLRTYLRRDGKVVVAGDGQVTMGASVIKHSAKKIRRLYNDKILAGFAGSTADALSLFARFENKLQEYHGNLPRAAVEMAKEWRTDRALRHLDALLLVADAKSTFLLSGDGDVIEPDDGICGIGSGGPFALAAARALAKHTKMSAREIATEAMRLASEICIYTNSQFSMEEL